MYLFFNFYFMFKFSQLTMLRWFQVNGKWVSNTCTCIHSPPNSPPIQAATWHWADFPVLASRSLLVLHVKSSSVSMSIPDSLTVPSPHSSPNPDNRKLILLSPWVYFCFVFYFWNFKDIYLKLYKVHLYNIIYEVYIKVGIFNVWTAASVSAIAHAVQP